MRSLHSRWVLTVVIVVGVLSVDSPASAAGPGGAERRPPPGVISRVSVSLSGGSGDGDSMAGTEKGLSVSAGGRYVAFSSYASNLVASDTNGQRDVFVRDMWAGRTTRVSVGPGGAQGNGESREASISADGRYVAFASFASNLVAADTNGTVDVFIRDLQRGRTVRASVGPGGVQGDGGGLSPDISAGGRYVAFQSSSSNLVPGDSNATTDVFVRDLATGAVERVSVKPDGGQSDVFAQAPSISADGSRVAFQAPFGLVPGEQPPVFTDLAVYVRDRARRTTTEISRGVEDARFFVNSNENPVISNDGRFVAFTFIGWGGVGVDPVPNVWLRDTRSGELRLVSADRQGQPSSAIGPVHRLDVSADGRFVTFGSFGRLVPADTDDLSDVHLWDGRTGKLRRLTGRQINPYGTSLGSLGPAISDDGRHVAFEADTTNLATGGVPGQVEVYLWSARRP